MVMAGLWFLVHTKEHMWVENGKFSLVERGLVAMHEWKIVEAS